MGYIDRVQRRFLREISISEERALLDYRLAPLQTRRSISILGLLHRITLGQVSTQIANLFPKAHEIVVPDNIFFFFYKAKALEPLQQLLALDLT